MRQEQWVSKIKNWRESHFVTWYDAILVSERKNPTEKQDKENNEA